MLKKTQLLAMAGGNFAIGSGALVIAGVIKPISQEFNVSLSSVGLLITVYALAYAVASPVLVFLLGGVSRKMVLIGALVIFFVGNVFGAMAPSYELLFVARIIAALGGALYTPTASGVAAATSTPETRARAISLVYGGLIVATVFGVPLGTFVGLSFGWRGTLFLVAAVSVVAALAIFFTLPDKIDTPRPNLQAWLAVFRRPALLLILSLTIIQLAAQLVVYAYITPILTSSLGLDATGITLMLIIFGVASVGGNYICGFSADRFGTRQTILVTLVVLVLTFFAFPLMKGSVLLMVLFLCLWGASGWGFNVPQQTRLVSLAGSAQSAILSLNASFLYVGQAIGAFVGGVVVGQSTNYDNLSLVAGCISILTIVVFLATWGTESRKAPVGVASVSR